MPSLAGIYTAQSQLDDLVYGGSDIAPPAEPLVAPGTAAPPTTTVDYPTATAGPPGSGSQYGAPEQAVGYGTQVPSSTPAAQPATAPAAQPATAPPGNGATQYYGGESANTGLGNSQEVVTSYPSTGAPTNYRSIQPATSPRMEPYEGAAPPPGTASASYPGGFDPAAQRSLDASYGQGAGYGGDTPSLDFLQPPAGTDPNTLGNLVAGFSQYDPVTSAVRDVQTVDPAAEAAKAGQSWEDFVTNPESATTIASLMLAGTRSPVRGGGLGRAAIRPIESPSPAERYTGAPGFVEPANPQPRASTRPNTVPDVEPVTMPPRARPGTVVSEVPQRVTVGPLESPSMGPRQGSISPRNAPPPERATGVIGQEGGPGSVIPLPARNVPMPEPPPVKPPPVTWERATGEVGWTPLSRQSRAALEEAAVGRRTAEEIADAQLTGRVQSAFRPGTEPSPGAVRSQGAAPPITEPVAAPAPGPIVSGRRPLISNRAKVLGLAGAGAGLAAYGQATETGRMDPSAIPPPTPKTKQPGVVGDPWDGQMVGSTEAQPIAVATAADGSTLEVPPIRKVIFANGEVAASEPVPISQQAYDAALARGEEPWLMTAEEADTLVAAGLIEEGVGAALAGQTVMAVPGWVEALRAAEAAATGGAAPIDPTNVSASGETRERDLVPVGGALTEVYPVNGSTAAPATAPATAPSTGGGGWVDYGSSGGGGGRSYGGGGRGYPATYPSDFGGDEGSGNPWDNPIFDRFFSTSGGQLTGLRGKSTKRRRGRPTMNRSTRSRPRSSSSQSPMPMPPLHGSDDALAAALALRER
jgi:hypothetical protein